VKEDVLKQGDDSKPGDVETGILPDIFGEYSTAATYEDSLGPAFCR
jgi:hypothetical protein